MRAVMWDAAAAAREGGGARFDPRKKYKSFLSLLTLNLMICIWMVVFLASACLGSASALIYLLWLFGSSSSSLRWSWCKTWEPTSSCFFWVAFMVFCAPFVPSLRQCHGYWSSPGNNLQITRQTRRLGRLEGVVYSSRLSGNILDGGGLRAVDI